MPNDLTAVAVRKIANTPQGAAVFLGAGNKTFVIYVGPYEGHAIARFLEQVKPPRPLTHDLISTIFTAFKIKLSGVVINELKNDTYYARLILEEQNELGRKIVELDARPSDALAIALQQGAKIFVKNEVLDIVPDMRALLDELNREQ